LRLAVLLNIKRQDDILPRMKVSADEHTLSISFPKDWLVNKPIFSADLAREADYIQALDLKLAYD
jgi:exopolyphosphatase/guanosine-5'-triphosphate,3'-diphosphate pyrophosphatase